MLLKLLQPEAKLLDSTSLKSTSNDIRFLDDFEDHFYLYVMNAVFVVNVDPKELCLGRHDRRTDINASYDPASTVVLRCLAVSQEATLQHKESRKGPT